MKSKFTASSLKGSTNTMISSPLKPHTNAHTCTGRKQRTEGKIYTRNMQCLVACAMLEL